MVKKLLSILFSAITLLSFGTIANAQGIPDMISNSDIQPYYEFVSNNKENLFFSNGQAICESTLTGYSGTTTKVKITMYLEKKTLWWWSTETSWTETFNNYRGALSKSYTVGGGRYRVKAVYVAYSGNQSETFTGLSLEIKI